MNNESLAQRPRLSEGDSRVLLAFHVGLLLMIVLVGLAWRTYTDATLRFRHTIDWFPNPASGVY